jgi:hypothetical protein
VIQIWNISILARSAILLLLLTFFEMPAFGQNLEIEVRATGKTSGHIGDLIITNKDSNIITGKIGPVLIPPKGAFQGIIIPDSTKYIINIKETKLIPIKGFCTDLFRTPYSTGEQMPGVLDWIKIEAGEDPTIPTPAKNIVLNPQYYPEFVAPYYLKALNQIEEAYEKTQSVKPFIYPKLGDSARTADTYIQNAFWIYCAELHRDEYRSSDLRNRIDVLWADQEKIRVNKIAKDVIEELTRGADSIWKHSTSLLDSAGLSTQGRVETTIANSETPKEMCKCTTCKFADRFIIENAETGERYVDEVPPHTRITIKSPPVLESDCPENCNFQISGGFSCHIYESCNLEVGTYGNNEYSRTLGDAGRIELKYVGTCICHGDKCDEVVVSQTIKVKENNKCCERFRCNHRFDASPAPMKISNPNAPDQFIEMNGSTLSFGAGGETATETFPFDIEALFCQLINNQIIGQTQVAAMAKQSGEAAVSYDLTMAGPTPQDGAHGNSYSFNYARGEYVNETSREFSASLYVNKETCEIQVQILLNGKVYEFQSN